MKLFLLFFTSGESKYNFILVDMVDMSGRDLNFGGPGPGILVGPEWSGGRIRISGPGQFKSARNFESTDPTKLTQSMHS